MTLTKANSRRSLLLLAMINDEVKRDTDILRAISPIFMPIAKKLAGRQYAVSEFAEELKEQFGLHVPPEALTEFADSLTNAGMLKRSRDNATTLYFWIDASGSQINEEIYSKLSNSVDDAVNQFIDFCNKQNDLLFHNWDADRAASVLFSYLVDNDADVAKAQKVILNNPKPESSVEDYVCARFIEEVSVSNQGVFETLSGITSSLLISEVVIELSTEQKADKNNSDVNIYLDAPVLISALELAGAERRNLYRDIAKAVIDRGAGIRVFRHTVEEVVSVLKAVLDAPPGSRKGPTATAISAGETTDLIVRSVAQSPESYIEKLGIVIDETDVKRLPANLERFFTNKDYEEVFSKLRAVHPDNVKAREFDTKSIGLIMAKRQGVGSANLFKTKHILLTDNRMVEAVGHRYYVESRNSPFRFIGPAISLSRMSAVIWIDGGLSKNISISRSQLLVSCAKTTALNPWLIERIRSSIRSINPDNANRYLSMLSQPRYLQMANDKFFGGRKEVTEELTIDLFEEIKAEIVAPQIKAREGEVRELKSKYNKAIEAERGKSKILQEELDSSFSRQCDALSKRMTAARLRGEKEGKFVCAFLVTLGFAVSFFVAFGSYAADRKILLVPIGYIIATIVFVLTILSIFSIGIRLDAVIDFFGKRKADSELDLIKREGAPIGTEIACEWSASSRQYAVSGIGSKDQKVVRESHVQGDLLS